MSPTLRSRHPRGELVVSARHRGRHRGIVNVASTDEVVFPAPDEIEGFWNLDKMHAPRPLTPLSFDLVLHPLAEGFTKSHEDYDCPIMTATKEINHYVYFSFHPLPDEGEVARRMVHYH